MDYIMWRIVFLAIFLKVADLAPGTVKSTQSKKSTPLGPSTTDIDECHSDPCQNGGTCANGNNGYSCECVPGFSGGNCSLDINECQPVPCQNSGTCVDKVNGYSCNCIQGYTGKTCLTNINECKYDPCQNGGTCADQINDYTCNCVPGYSGKTCSIDINECQPVPCQNSGTCVDKVNGYSCNCIQGYTGKTCLTNINECKYDPCQNGGTCADKINGYSCNCASGYSGKTCSIDIDECRSDPCQNRGTCADKINGYSCNCVPGYTGKHCSIDIDECQSDQCQNGGTCVDEINGYSCKCAPGYTGENCATVITCNDSGNAENAKTNFTGSAVFGSKIVYSCKTDYQHTTGDLTRTCQENGTLSGSHPVCVITCSSPEAVNNAENNYTSRVVSGSQIMYNCVTNFQHTTGDTTRTCQANGTWSGAPIVCRSKLGSYCFTPEQCIPNAKCTKYGSDTEERCSCSAGFYDNDFNQTNVGGSCVSEKKLNESCTQKDKDIECKNRIFTVCSSFEYNGKYVCRCKNNYEEKNGTCFKRPPAPTIDLKSTNETIMFNAKSPKDNRVNGIFVIYFDENIGIRRNKSVNGKHLISGVVDGLNPGSCYNLTFHSLFDKTISFYTTQKKYCTVPNQPLSVEVLAYYNSSILILITNGSGNFENYEIEIKGVKYIETTNTTVEINDLQAGYMYDIHVRTQANGVKSTSFHIHQPTNPAAPVSVSVRNQTSNSISVDIVHGIGIVQSFYIMVNASYNLSGKVKPGTENTCIIIPNLMPGKCYTNITIESVSHNLTSNSILVEQHSTNPDVPRSIIVTNQSLQSISLKLVHGDGMVQSFIIIVTQNITVRPGAVRDKPCTDVIIAGLIPGMLYDKIMIQSVSNNLTSKEKHLRPTGTYPDIPRLHNISSQTNDTMTVNIMHGQGVVQLFYINIDGLYHEKSSASTDNNNSRIVISNLIPGTLYKSITIQAVSNNLKSRSVNLMSHSTNPNAPKSVDFTNQSTKSLRMNIVHGRGIVESFKIEVNKSYTVFENASSDAQSTQIVISGLIPGTLYDNLIIRCVSHNLYSSVFKAQNHATIPDQPHNITVTDQTTNTLTVIIFHGIGIVQSFLIQINDSYRLNFNATKNVDKTDIIIPKLTPGTLYVIKIASISHKLQSEAKQMAPYSTVPDIPQSIKVLNQTTESITININHGEGGVQSFIVQVNDSYWLNKTANISSATYIMIPRLTPGILYSNINIQAQFHGLKSIIKSVPKHGTNPSQPVLEYRNSTTRSISILIVQGKGYVDGYKVLIDGNWKQNITNSLSNTRVNISVLIPGQMYRITVIAVSNDLISIESNAVHSATYPPVPYFNITGYSSTKVNMTVGITEGNAQTYTAIFENVNKSIHCGSDYQTTVDAGSFSLDNLTAGTKYNVYVQSSMHSLTSNSISQTLITDPSTPTFSFSKTSVHSVAITITKGSGCVHHYDIYVNGKKKKTVSASSETVNSVINDLDDGKTFHINVLSVSYGQNSSLPLALAAATKQDPVPIAGGAVAGIVAAIVVVLLFIAWRKQLMCFNKRKPSYVSEGRHNTAFDDVEVEMTSKEKKRPIKLVDIASQIDNKSGNSNMGFSQDFKDLGILSPKHEMNESQIQENRPKNRYTNILPFDHSIVKLIEIEDEPGSDFINANYIPGYSSPREYIASQGPLPATLADFWRMVWEQNVSIIVMLTQLLERGRKKCELYWPEDTKEKRFFGDIIVEVESDSFLPEYALRIIVLRMGDVERRIRHYNYLAWPDMGTPKTSNNMITFVDTIRREVKPTTNGPILVHCSAGVGRTGTFIVMDILLQELRSGRQEVDIFGTILKLRNNRVNMVQTEDQYVFIFNCIKDFIEASADSAADSEPLYENVRVNSRKN